LSAVSTPEPASLILFCIGIAIIAGYVSPWRVSACTAGFDPFGPLSRKRYAASATGGIVVSLSDHKDAITSLRWCGDGALLASGSEDGQIIIWSAVDGFLVATISPKPVSGVESLDFTPDGRLVSVARDNKIRFWSGDGKPKEASAADDALLPKVVAPYDSKLVIAGDYKGRILLWDGKLSVPGAGDPSQGAVAT
jgi:WD40 repeat protein